MVMIRPGSREFLFFDLRIAGEVPSTPTVETAVVASGTSPAEGDWSPALYADGTVRLMADGVPRGRWDVYARVTDVPERPLLYAGRLEVR